MSECMFDFDRDEPKITDTEINIYVINNGRSKNTYIEGWELTHKELVGHLQNIKKFNGCNGSVKDGVIHLQGMHNQTLKDYLIKCGIHIASINFK
jgi:translation initiation factor 1 (eIF-1/SUI1)